MTITLYELTPSHARSKTTGGQLGIPLEKVPLDPRIGETRSSDFLAKIRTGAFRPSKRTASCCGNRRQF